MREITTCSKTAYNTWLACTKGFSANPPCCCCVSPLDRRQWTKQKMWTSSEFSAQKRNRRTNFKFYTPMHDWTRVFNVDRCPSLCAHTICMSQLLFLGTRRKTPSCGFCNRAGRADRRSTRVIVSVTGRDDLHSELFTDRFVRFICVVEKVWLVEGILVS